MARMNEWDVEIDFAADPRLDRIEDVADAFVDLTVNVDGVAGVHEGTLTVAVTIRARDYREAIDEATEGIMTSLARITPIELEIARVQASTAEWTQAAVDRPLPEMMGVAEVAERLEVTKQRVAELRDAERLPAPLTHLRSGPIWPRPAIERFLEGWDRRPGRPKSSEGRVTGLLDAALRSTASTVAQYATSTQARRGHPPAKKSAAKSASRARAYQDARSSKTTKERM